MNKETPKNNIAKKIQAHKKSVWVAPELLDLDLIRTRGTKDAIGSDEETQCCGATIFDKLLLSPS